MPYQTQKPSILGTEFRSRGAKMARDQISSEGGWVLGMKTSEDRIRVRPNRAQRSQIPEAQRCFHPDWCMLKLSLVRIALCGAKKVTEMLFP